MNKLGVLVVLLCAIMFLGCLNNQQNAGNTGIVTNNNSGNSPANSSVNNTVNNTNNPTNQVPPKPLSDSAVIKAKVLSFNNMTAQLEILEVVSYQADMRDGTVKLKSGDAKNFIFQWGTAEITVNPPSGTMHFPGINVNDTIQANVSSINNLWRVYGYEKIG